MELSHSDHRLSMSHEVQRHSQGPSVCGQIMCVSNCSNNIPGCHLKKTHCYCTGGGAAWMFDEFLKAICLTSAIYGFFNLVPIPPLDGSKVLHHFLPEAGQEIMDNIAPYGMFLIFILFWAGNAGVIFMYPMLMVYMAWGLF